METVIIDYVKRMFGSSRPEWTPECEGLLLYDIDNNVWVGGDDVGWIEIKSLGD